MNDLISDAPAGAPLRVRFGTKAIAFAGVVVVPAGGAAPTGFVAVHLTDATGRVWAEGGAEVGDRGRFVAELDTANLPVFPALYTITYRYSGTHQVASSTCVGLLQVDPPDHEIVVRDAVPRSGASCGEGPFRPEATAAADPVAVAPDTSRSMISGVGEIMARARDDGGESDLSASTQKPTPVLRSAPVVSAENAEAVGPLRDRIRGSTTVVRSSDGASTFGRPVTFTASVRAADRGRGRPAGKVCFQDDATDAKSGETRRTLLGTARLMNGTASLTTTALAAGTHAVTAVYQGDGEFAGGASEPLPQTVHPAATVVTLRSLRHPSVYGQAVGFTAVVAAAEPGGRVPEGAVRFYNDATLLGAAVVRNGKAVLPPLEGLGAGAHAITAVHAGDADYLDGASDAMVQQVKKAATLPQVVEDIFLSDEKTIVLRVSVLPRPPARGPVRRGTVTVGSGPRILGAAPIDPVSGQAVVAFDVVGRSGRDHALVVRYRDDGGDFLDSLATLVLATPAEVR